MAARDAENVLAVRHRVKHVVPQMLAEQDHLFGVATGAEPAPPATEGQQVFVVAIRTTDPGKTIAQIAATQKALHHIGNQIRSTLPLRSNLTFIPQNSRACFSCRINTFAPPQGPEVDLKFIATVAIFFLNKSFCISVKSCPKHVILLSGRNFSFLWDSS